ncbi:MAG: DNA adenine methylase [Usitatibacteraceae bacterium]
MNLLAELNRDDPGMGQMELFRSETAGPECRNYLSEQLITYIGNKRRLIPMIEDALRQSVAGLGKSSIAFADVFAGTGVVSRMARRYAHRLHVNDFEEYSAFSNTVYHTNKAMAPLGEIEKWRTSVCSEANQSPRAGFITELYSPRDEQRITADDRVFYTRRNAMFIDTARTAINAAPVHIQPFILAPLLQRASVHVNTSGVFKGFYKNTQGIGQFGGTMKNALQRIKAPIDIPLPVLSRFSREVNVSQMEAQKFVETLPEVDVAYFDPPYNQHPYGSNYFMLNLILRNEAPGDVSRVSGIPKGWQRSPYNVRSEAAGALEQLLQTCPARTLLISYNSEGFISPEQMLDMIEPLGTVNVFDKQYNTFRGCRNLSGRSAHVTEMLFKVQRS